VAFTYDSESPVWPTVVALFGQRSGLAPFLRLTIVNHNTADQHTPSRKESRGPGAKLARRGGERKRTCPQAGRYQKVDRPRRYDRQQRNRRLEQGWLVSPWMHRATMASQK
jgi:hypothetical protein